MLFFSIVLLASGCAGTYTAVSFEILEPATVNLPDNVKQVLILNRSPRSDELYQKEDINGLNKEQLFILDTLISNNIMRGLNSKLRESTMPVFNNPIWLSQRRNDTIGLNIPLTKRDVNEICFNNGCDAIISLEYFLLHVTDTFFYEDGDVWNIRYKYSNTAKWQIYLKGSPIPFDTYVTSDTVYYDRYINEIQMMDEVPSTVDLVKSVSNITGETYGRYLSPSWSRIDRIMYRGKEDILRKTSRMTDRGDWDEAYAVWDSLSLLKDSVLAAKANYNMAVYHELEDDLMSALRLVIQSEKLDSTEIAESYREDLQVRLLNRSRIIKQIQ